MYNHRTPETGENRLGSVTYTVVVCLVAALGGLLFGYDTAVISGAIGFLQTRFGLSPFWKGWAASSALIGCIIGAALAGTVSDAMGRKKVLMLSAVLFLVSAIGTALPRSLFEFIIFRMIGGVGVGAASMSSPMYIAEITPAHIRGRMVSVNQFAIVFGMLVVYFVNYAIAGVGNEAWNVQVGWRWMFGSESFPALALLILLFFVPESPRWLAKQGRDKEALRILGRVGGSDHARREFEAIRLAIAQESGSIAQLFESGFRIALLIGVVLAILQQVTGINVILYYAPEIFKSLGTATATALGQTVIIGSVNMAFTIIAIWSVDRLGRRPLMMIGATGMGLSLFSLGLAAYLQITASWALFFVLSYIACFALSLGPVVWVVLSEIFPTRIRGRAMAIATVFLWSANFVVSQTFPMIDENAWLIEHFHHGFSYWIYGALCVVTLVFVYRWVPETKERSLEEIEAMWAGAAEAPRARLAPDQRTP
jgi:MFS transporter, SP family, xylose:H+ symportor